jgi:hypothetical protein
MRTQAHRIVDTDPKRGNVVVRLTDPPRRARRAAVIVARKPHRRLTYGSEATFCKHTIAKKKT